jgi:hypothetical protein
MLKRKIKAVKFVRDMAAGLDDWALMDNYELTEKQLLRVFRELIQSQFVTTDQLRTRAAMTDTQITEVFVGKHGEIEVPE